MPFLTTLQPHARGIERVPGRGKCHDLSVCYGAAVRRDTTGGHVALVEFEDPADGRDYMLRLSLDRLAPATAERLQEMAKRYERMAGDLRRLALVAQ